MFPHFELDREHHLAYLIMKKCGCTSIVTAMRKIKDDELDPAELRKVHGTLEVPRLEELNGGKGWYTFTLVRDPVRRFLSFYSNKIQARTLNVNKVVSNPVVTGYRVNMSLNEAIDAMVSKRFKMDPHAGPQTTLIDNCGFPLNYVGRFESFGESLKHVENETGVNIPIKHLNPRRHPPLPINREQFEKLSEYYSEDQRRFGYPQEFDKWSEENLEIADSERQLPGVVFENEAALVDHRILAQDDHFELQLDWHVLPGSSRDRVIRAVRLDENRKRHELFRIGDVARLSESLPDGGSHSETLEIPFEKFPADIDPTTIGIELYFWSRENKWTVIQNFHNSKSGRLLLGLPPQTSA